MLASAAIGSFVMQSFSASTQRRFEAFHFDNGQQLRMTALWACGIVYDDVDDDDADDDDNDGNDDGKDVSPTS